MCLLCFTAFLMVLEALSLGLIYARVSNVLEVTNLFSFSSA
jgi:hypothetical protein